MNTPENTDSTNTTPATDAPERKTGQATYSPEDNKLRLYIGRVPRDEYLKLKAQGWTTLHKQREAGGGDFVATWTPSRRDTALEYADIIEDEDMGPEERAADRAERFSGYRDRRAADATGHADRYDAQPAAHGFQDAKRAERAAARHDRIADRAGDAWSKAEYWQRRTAGVISHALYKSSPGVRMGRIKTIEAELRKCRASLEEYGKLWRDFEKLAAIADPEQQTKTVRAYLGARHVWAEYMHPRLDTVTNPRLKEHPTSLYTLITMTETGYGTSDITGAEACTLFFSDHAAPKTDTDWTTHLELRRAYENQMLAAAGGRLEQCEVLPGGKLGGKLIIKVSKSSVTKRATSCDVLGPKVSGWTYKAANIPGTEFAAYKFDLERMSPDAYTPPTPESLAELKAFNAARKAATPVKAPCPLINPTDADAERLQAVWNERAKAEHCGRHLKEYGQDYAADFVPATVCRITQAVYSANSKGSYARAETRGVKADAQRARRASNLYSSSGRDYDQRTGPAVCEVRITQEAHGKQFTPPRVIILTDKPQKPFPAAVWEVYTPAAPLVPELNTGKVLSGKSGGLSYTVNA